MIMTLKEVWLEINPFSEGVRIALDYILSHPEECQKEDSEFDEWCDQVIDTIEKGINKFL